MKKRKVLIRLLLIVQLSILYSCDFYGNKDLGDKFTLWARDNEVGKYDIVYCSRYDIGGCISGIYVIPTADSIYYNYVETAKSNENWVIAKTIRIADQKEHYWVINKDFSLENVDCYKVSCDSIIQSHVIGALNYQEFTAKRKELDINLKLEK